MALNTQTVIYTTTVTTLRAIPLSTINGGLKQVFLQGESGLDDGLQGEFLWDSTSTAGASDDVVVPSFVTNPSIAGRWLRSPDGPMATQVTTNTADIATNTADISTLQTQVAGLTVAGGAPHYESEAAAEADGGLANGSLYLVVPGTVSASSIADEFIKDSGVASTYVGSWIVWPAAGAVGDLATYTLNNGVEVVTRPDLSLQPNIAIDLTDSENYQIRASNGANTSTWFSVALDGSDLDFTNSHGSIYALVAEFSEQIGAYKTIRATGVYTGTTAAASGFCLALMTSAPTLGSAAATLPNDNGTCLITWRPNGSAISYKQDATTNPASGVTFTGTVGTWVIGDSLDIILKLNSSGTAGTVSFLRNNVNTGDVEISGLTASSYIGVGFRTSGVLPETFTISSPIVYYPSLDVVKYAYIDADAMADGDGSEVSPFNTLQSLQEAIDTDTRRTHLHIIRKDSSVLRGAITIDGTQWRNVTIEATGDASPLYYASKFIENGTAAWTNIGGATPNVWYMTAHWNDATGSTSSNAGLVEVTSGVMQYGGLTGRDSGGVSGTYGVPWWVYYRATPNLSVATLNDTANRGVMTKHTSGTYAGKILINPRGGLDPNTLDFEEAIYNSCLRVNGNDSDWNACTVKIHRGDFRYAYDSNIFAEYANVFLSELFSRGCSVTYGIQLTACGGTATSVVSEGNAADSWNWKEGGFPADGEFPKYCLFDTTGGPQPTLGALAVSEGKIGDCYSNESKQILWMCNPKMLGGAKDGLAAINDFTVLNAFVDDCVDSGIVLAPQDGAELTGEIEGGEYVNSNIGIQANAGVNTSGSCTINVKNAIFSGNVDSHIRAFGTTVVPVVNVKNCSSTGTTPSSGNFHGATINAPIYTEMNS